MTQTQPSTEWKPQPGKPAMTRDGKTLVTDLVRHKQWGLWSEWLIRAWNAEGHALGGEPFRDLIEPTAAILAAHGIDADGKPVADHDIRQAGGFLHTKICDVCGATDATGDDRLGKSCPGKPVAKVTCEDCGGTGLVLNTIGEPDECRECHGNTVVDAPGTFADGGKSWDPDAPASPTPIDVAYIPAIKLAEIMELAKRQPYGTPIAIEHDGFKGVVIGWYVRLDGVPGIVAQLDNAKVVHVYGEKWLNMMTEDGSRLIEPRDLIPCPKCGGVDLEVFSDVVQCLTETCDAEGPRQPGPDGATYWRIAILDWNEWARKLAEKSS